MQIAPINDNKPEADGGGGIAPQADMPPADTKKYVDAARREREASDTLPSDVETPD